MKKLSSGDMKTVIVRLLNKDEKLNILRRKRLDLINELKSITYLILLSCLLIFPLIPLIYFKMKNRKKIHKIKEINQKIIEIGGYEPKYQKIWNIKGWWKF